jgi:DNA-binding LacI/PurR family transcriptional regulator
VGKHVRHSALEAAVARLVAQARAAGCTALVCANDSAALAALDMLRARGVSVPEEISVMGFDDTLEAHQVRLTRYNFGALQATRALVNHVLAPRTRRQRQERVEVEGFVVKRASCGRAPHPANARRHAANP